MLAFPFFLAIMIAYAVAAALTYAFQVPPSSMVTALLIRTFLAFLPLLLAATLASALLASFIVTAMLVYTLLVLLLSFLAATLANAVAVLLVVFLCVDWISLTEML